MHILLVAATKLEIAPFLEKAGLRVGEEVFSSYSYKSHTLDVLITGVGAAQTAYYLGKYLNSKYDLAINAGICGSFESNLKLGEVVQVTEDYFADLGAEDGDKFISVSELGLPGAYYVKNENPFVVEKLKPVRAVTVNTTHGNEATIQKFRARLKADVESMEGASFLFACNTERVKSLQIRAVSNYVEKRDRSKWKIQEAITGLTEVLVEVLNAFSHIG